MLNYLESLIIFILIYWVIYFTSLKRKNNIYTLKFSIMFLYLFLVLCATILPIDFTLDLKWKYHSSLNFVYVHTKPFNDLILGHDGALKQIILNIVMTIPFGFLCSSFKTNVRIILVIMATFFFSFIIEIIQLIMTMFLLHYRTCDVTDLITNTIGGMIGFTLFKCFEKKLLKYK